MKSQTLTISINCTPAKVYEFVSNAENLPKWANTFVKSARKETSGWVIETELGSMKVRFVEKNRFGVLDHYLTPPGGQEFAVSMRVIPNGEGSEMIFTIFQRPGMTEEAFAKDAELVTKDLASLKAVMEQTRE
jgi:hypothetical protein